MGVGFSPFHFVQLVLMISDFPSPESKLVLVNFVSSVEEEGKRQKKKNVFYEERTEFTFSLNV